MSIELRPLGVKCNIGCQYCYQNMHRDAGNGNSTYEMSKMKESILREGDSFHLFGGEPLLMKEDDLDELLRWGNEQFGENTVITNGALITDNHIRMFREHNVSVGISIDGPDELNDIRWAGTLEKTREATSKSISSIYRLRENNICVGLQIQVTKCNSTADRLPKMLEWLRCMDKLLINSARLHILEIDHPLVREVYAFSARENIAVFETYRQFEKELVNLRFDMFADLRNMLLGHDEDSTCVWNACDPYTTESVNGMDGEGRKNNCGLTDKEGINFQKPDKAGYERYIALYHTPQEFGGCKDCRFFLSCKGQCPGTAIQRDWRNKSENCEVWKNLFTVLESELLEEGLEPVSVSPERTQLEKRMLLDWQKGHNTTIRFQQQTLTDELAENCIPAEGSV